MKKALFWIVLIVTFFVVSIANAAEWHTERHIVKKGENLFKIAESYHISLSVVMKENSWLIRRKSPTRKLVGYNYLLPGDVIIIPVVSRKSTAGIRASLWAMNIGSNEKGAFFGGNDLKNQLFLSWKPLTFADLRKEDVFSVFCLVHCGNDLRSQLPTEKMVGASANNNISHALRAIDCFPTTLEVQAQWSRKQQLASSFLSYASVSQGNKRLLRRPVPRFQTVNAVEWHRMHDLGAVIAKQAQEQQQKRLLIGLVGSALFSGLLVICFYRSRRPKKKRLSGSAESLPLDLKWKNFIKKHQTRTIRFVLENIIIEVKVRKDNGIVVTAGFCFRNPYELLFALKDFSEDEQNKILRKFKIVVLEKDNTPLFKTGIYRKGGKYYLKKVPPGMKNGFGGFRQISAAFENIPLL